MKKNFKRILASFICLLMIFGTFASGKSLLTVVLVKASAVTYSTGDIIEYGNYPQSKVTDEKLSSELTNKAGKISSWENCGYNEETDATASSSPRDLLCYKDISYNGDNYRGVAVDNVKNDKNNVVYWFKYEPIKWEVINPSTGLVVANIIVDMHQFNKYNYWYDYDEDNVVDNDEVFSDKNAKFHSSDFLNSSIRMWLNSDFFNTAFTETQKSKIKYTNQTNSKMFLLSRDEVKVPGEKPVSNYAKHMNLNFVANDKHSWMLLSPVGGAATDCVSDTNTGFEYGSVTNTYGVVPAMVLSSIDSDITLTNISSSSDEQGKFSLVDTIKSFIENISNIFAIIKNWFLGLFK